ncbi:MAG: 1-(5-phosphoribosyl)-5-[(5-phosphoribosylamino)methylideneamino]imidazole-4-carboxamide isomerase [Lentisphaerae bacterium]|nr:1-(5-phosphoribosyl)-5-[(5-phosphoribosylamino)methylideneamino]imidazole-4-carboxamide isomerase [Lentisphaerota bacterium]
MLIIPAIDLKNGKCVRLRQGRAEDATVYSADPVAVAAQWVAQGARRLHVVDLDGAFEGRPVHTALMAEIARACGAPVQAGGGLRTDAHVRRLLDAGIACAIVGTRAFSETDALTALAAEFGAALAVGIDARDGLVSVRGWVETTRVTAADLARRVEAAGVRTIVYTDISRDGMLEGVNADATGAMCRCVGCDVIASGGVSSARDVASLAALDRPNLVGAIVGKALYDGRADLRSLIAAAG